MLRSIQSRALLLHRPAFHRSTVVTVAEDKVARLEARTALRPPEAVELDAQREVVAAAEPDAQQEAVAAVVEPI